MSKEKKKEQSSLKPTEPSNFDKLYVQREEERAKLIETYGTSFPGQKGQNTGAGRGGQQQQQQR